ncbi:MULTISPECIES: hypothetical protein [unclassified Planococcus (in: firmicutes)]|uniref:hypothetical protein n=1 Tax=unclassified Planococcus (in: firmicutes) TaxID=2662419 RepID=UPI000C795805|nr:MULTISPECIES: hypothetical protein [unclassified Planococcus (in: firmicutes)]PKG46554.1 hypothetical protein CXF66_06675 [Planococcus sp. Urea-trap-24]PKG89760.1 hypothetical protein CXF91_06130 [Planococcus sp. Urea-3u-39]PKH40837.1 hypothetical protein CXF77_07265 [Planococcus sp. MB-3u-09]
MNEGNYSVYYRARTNDYIIVAFDDEKDGKKKLDLLVKGYSTLTETASSYEDAENFIMEYLYQKMTTFSIQRGY